MQVARLTLVLFLCSAISIAVAQVPNDFGEPGVITGKVIDAAGHTIPDAKVYITDGLHVGGVLRYVTTDQNGEFRIENLRPGDYDVYAVPGHSAAMLRRWGRRVHLSRERPTGQVTVRVRSATGREG